ncbi:MAG TPA: tRNA uridine-5-carboxymethylaminomethyl(34) synthesis GTPase MnmE [Bacteroidia bacterium]|nr:tRNA uridine-5-carboxymethylaminomethyl(34) synthesis GTPase MnmE [Bacteroidia bacterium]HRS59297.1 tRNA uridine-5-carboxymethylaminomethyl(34) synthesis GTPase MnmE [Bacteroidia bacterium]HRU68237.1 tRNA uridine-5-carboxymethylaminomethyl(34) synthesis GTPase MnmE [Bacteroidia bacterium]
MFNPFNEDTIAAISTPPGKSAIGIIRLSGKDAFKITASVFKGKDPAECESHTIHFGHVVNSENQLIDEVLVSVFKAPKSYTGEDVIEISCHGSTYILSEIMKLLCSKGARPARPGEFTLRAFIHKKIDLAKAEGIADMIDSESKAAHQLAVQHIRGGFSEKINNLRGELLNILTLFELELDFAEEDVEFATNSQLLEIVDRVEKEVNFLCNSFHLGNVLKKGVSVVIAGRPNAGKSTLLNALLNEERAIISEIPGTTRDFIEDVININGIDFRFIDTAGITKTSDWIEQKGIEKTYEKIETADLLIYLFDINALSPEELLEDLKNIGQTERLIVTGNKTDKTDEEKVKEISELLREHNFTSVFISSKFHHHLDELKNILQQKLNPEKYAGEVTIVSNVRHYHLLKEINENISEVRQQIASGISKDLIALNLRTITNLMGEITGQITTEEVLENVFSRFCIGK